MTDSPQSSISQRFPRRALGLRLALVLATVALAVGLFAPMITIQKMILVTNTFSVVSGVYQLLLDEHWGLFLLVGAFSVLLPVLKLGVLYRLLSPGAEAGSKMSHYLHWMHLYGKWSMLDVFVVAVLVVAVKLGALVQVDMHYGLYAFAAAVLLTMGVTAGVVYLSERMPEEKAAEES